VGEEAQVLLGEPDHLGGRPGFPAGDQQAAGHVVHAVAVLAPDDRVAGVLEQAGVVGEAGDVLPARQRCVRDLDRRRHQPQTRTHA
jgi:hypothetical protein